MGFSQKKKLCVATVRRVFKGLDVTGFEAVVGNCLVNSGVELDDPPKRRHGQLDRRESWALADTELNSYAGSAGSNGKARLNQQKVCRIGLQRWVKGKQQV